MATQRTDDSKSDGTTTPPAGAVQPGSSESQPRSARRRTVQRDADATSASPQRAEVSNEARYVMIQEAAYLRAERRGFEPGFELEDWLAAENEIDTLLGAASPSRAPQ